VTETVKLNMDEMIQRFRFIGKNLAPTIYRAMLVSAQAMLRKGVVEHMSGAKRGSGPSLLGVETGSARRSMIDQAGLAADKVFALIGSPLGYVRAHEEGFDGPVQVRAHTRRIIRLKRNTRTGRVSKKSAAAYKASVRKGGKRFAYVRAHDRKVDIVAKHFIRDTVLESVAPTEQRILKALMIAARTGKIPTTGQLGA